MRYECAQERRLRAVKLAGVLNGIEFVEVVPQTTVQVVQVHLLKPAAGILAAQVRIDGGERIRTVEVVSVSASGNVLEVTTAQSGDFSYYTLHIDSPGFDPLLREIKFSFKVDCDAGFDCRDGCVCASPAESMPEIDYLAKDYASFRRMLLDRIGLLSPRWRERNPADIGVMLVELLAHQADRLSYRQDAIATESYLETARSRISLRRHARLVDYRMHDGCSARVLLHVGVEGNGVVLDAHTRVYSRVPGLPVRLDPEGERAALESGATVFETVDQAVLYEGHREFTLYTWGDADCELPQGATSATLLGDHPHLKAGDILILAETWPVRLTHVVPSQDPSGGRFLDPPTNDPVAVTEIRWDEADALGASLKATVAWGNIVVADHGSSKEEELGEALRRGPLTRSVEVNPRIIVSTEPDQGVLDDLEALDPSTTIRDWLSGHGVVFRRAPLVVRGGHDEWSVSDGETVVRVRDEGNLVLLGRAMPAGALLKAEPRLARPQITLDDGISTWVPQWDLLASDEGANEFAVESEHDGVTYVRLNHPATGLKARYRVGNGVAGNVGAFVFAHAATNATVTALINPLPAGGGHEPEAAEEVRRDAPEAFLVQQRAVTPADWQEVATRDSRVQRAQATWRWTGSWHTVFLTVDRVGGAEVDAEFERDIRAGLERYRMAGYDLEVDGPRYVPLELGLHVCVAEGHLRSAVRQRVIRELRRLFEPDRLTFAQPVYLSPVYAAAQGIPGVTSVNVHTFRRRYDPWVSGVATGVLKMGRLEVARLDNNPNFPERGTLTVTLGGGK